MKIIALSLLSLSLSHFGWSQNWNLVNKTYASPAVSELANSKYGNAVAIDDDVAVVASQYYNSEGRVFVLQFDGFIWNNVAVLTPDVFESGSTYGKSVAIQDDIIVVGSTNNKVYVYEKPIGGWVDMTQSATLTPNGGFVSQWFGAVVSIDSNQIVVGAPNDDVFSEASGSAYVFQKPVSGWVDMTQTAKLTPSVGTNYAEFGCALDISDNTIVIGTASSSGEIYVYEKPVTGWVSTTEDLQLQKSSGSSVTYPISFDNETIVVGDKNYYEGGVNSGAVFVYQKPITGWVNNAFEDAILKPTDEIGGENFGWSVCIDSNIIAVGDNFDEQTFEYQGAVYFYTSDNGDWSSTTENSVLYANDAAEEDYFGYAVAMNGDKLVVGTLFDEGNVADVGSAYFYSRDFSGVSIQQNQVEVKFFPNPVKDVLQIEFQSVDFYKIEVIDLQGKVCLERFVNSNSAQISTDQLAPGAYIITVSSQNLTRINKELIKLN